MRTVVARVLFVVGTLCLVFGLFAGLVNREVVDGHRFADHVDSMRQDPAVAREIGLVISGQLIDAAPELVALRPLVESVSAATVASPAAGPVVRAAVVPLHRALVEGTSVEPILRLADGAAVAVAALQAVAPDVAAKLPDNADVTLSRLGASSFDTRVVAYAHWARILSWVLPLLGLAAVVGSALLRRRAWSTVVQTLGHALLWVSGAVVFVVLGATVTTALISTDSVVGALMVAAWHEVDGRLWIVAAVGAVIGLVLQALGGYRPMTEEGAVALWRRVTAPSSSPVTLAARGGVLVLVGVLAVVEPAVVLGAVAVVLGATALWLGARDLLTSAIEWVDRHGHTVGARVAATLPLLLVFALIAGVTYLAWPKDPTGALLTAQAGDPDACNGHVELCDRRYNEIAYPATHNSMSAQDEPGWFIGEQATGVTGQLDDGIRVFLIDSWYGQMSNRPPLVANTDDSRAQAMAAAQQIYGPEVVDSALRVRNALDLQPVGPLKPYLCHELCELGSTEWLPLMKRVREWIGAHPREVVTFFVQDMVAPPDVETLLREAGLYDLLYTPTSGQPWPTLREMIDSGQRLVWLHENVGGGPERPWLLAGDEWVQDTPYEFRSADEFSCAAFRGSPTAPLFLVNHWLSNFTTRIRDANIVNREAVLLPRLEQCRDERAMIPNFVAVDNYTIGDLFASVDSINGVS